MRRASGHLGCPRNPVVSQLVGFDVFGPALLLPTLPWQRGEHLFNVSHIHPLVTAWIPLTQTPPPQQLLRQESTLWWPHHGLNADAFSNV